MNYLPRKKKSFAWEVGGPGAITTGYGGKGEGGKRGNGGRKGCLLSRLLCT